MNKHPRVLVLTEDVGLAKVRVRGFFTLGIDAFWVTEEGGEGSRWRGDVRVWSTVAMQGNPQQAYSSGADHSDITQALPIIQIPVALSLR